MLKDMPTVMEMALHVNEIMEKAWNAGDVAALDMILAPDLLFHHPPFPDLIGIEAYKQHILDDRATFPDLSIALEEPIVGPHGGAVRWTMTMKHLENWPTATMPTDNPVIVTGVTVSRAENGKIVEMWEYGDYLGMFQQLGLAPMR
ncbi:MAG: ester cyclase [Anaerolineae bacterium]